MCCGIHIVDHSLIIVKRFSKSNLSRRNTILLYENIIALCKEKRISISKLEKETGLGNATIRGWAESSPRLEKVKAVADFFGVTVDSLLTAPEEKTA